MTPPSASSTFANTQGATVGQSQLFSLQLKEWTDRLPREWCAGCTMSWEEFWGWERCDDALLVDIRDEVRNREVPGAIHVPMGTFLSQMAKHELVDEDEDVAIFCNTDNRSCMSLFLLKAMGYTQIKKIDGGYQEYLRLQKLRTQAAS